MTTEGKSASIERFVKSARRLILIQIFVGVLALGAVVVASIQIVNAVNVTEKAAQAEEDAAEATQVAEVSTQRSQTFIALASMSRQILRASTPEEFAAAADALQDQASLVQDADVFSLLATAHYRAAGDPVTWCLATEPALGAPDCDGEQVAAEKKARTLRLVSAAANAVESIRANAADMSGGGEAAPTVDVTSFLDLAAFQCAAVREQAIDPSDPDVEGFLAAVSVVTLPPQVRDQLRFSPARISEHNVLRRECTGPLEPIARVWLLGAPDETGSQDIPEDNNSAGLPQDVGGEGGQTAAAEPFGISNLYFHVPDQASRALSSEIGGATARALSSRFRGTEVITQHQSSYRSSIRYYYEEQAGDAKRLRETILREAAALDVALTEDSLPVVQLRIANLPVDNIEVWLPELQPESQQAQADQTASVSRIRALEIRYYQRPADGLRVVSALTPLVASPAELRIENPQISGDAVNAVACNPDISGESLEEFKLMVLALMSAGIEINHISGFRRPALGAASKPANRVEILRSSFETDRPLQEADIRALESCPRAGRMLRRN